MMNDQKQNIPRFDEMFKPILQALNNLDGEANLEDLNQEAINLLALSPELLAISHTDKGSDHRTEVEYRLAWARSYLKQYGLLDNPTRGVWCLTDAYDDSEDISPKLIVRSVRQKRLEDFKESENTRTSLESALAFDRFASAALLDYAEQSEKVISFNVLENNYIYDAIMPYGMHNDDTTRTYIEVKSSLKYFNAAALDRFSYRANGIKRSDRLLVIIGENLPAKQKNDILCALQEGVECEIQIWDYNDLTQHVGREPDYIEFLESPQSALIKDTILHSATQSDREQIRDARIERLKLEYRKQNVTLFLGAGVSKESGLPLWSTLIHRMFVSMFNENTIGEEISDQDLEELTKFAEKYKEFTPLKQVRYISSGLSPEIYYEIVRKGLYAKDVDLQTELLNAICEISMSKRSHIGVKGIVTYNFDNLLEKKFTERNIEFNTVYREKDIPSIDDLNIYHVHGYLPDSEMEEIDPDMTLIFSEEDYHGVYQDSYCWSNLTQLNAFRESTCLFIGCSLDDPNLRRLLDVHKRSCDEPRHYAIMKREKPNSKESHGISKRLLTLFSQIDDSIQDNYFQSIGINVIWVDDYNEIPEILRSLRRK